MAEVAFETEFRWEFGEAVLDVHLDAVVFAATLVRWFESAAIGWAGESHELIETVAKAAETAAGAIDNTVSPTGFAAMVIGFADDLFRNFDETVENIADRAAKFALTGVLRSRRCVDICGSHAAQGDHGRSDDDEFFHAEEKLEIPGGGWQWFFGLCERKQGRSSTAPAFQSFRARSFERGGCREWSGVAPEGLPLARYRLR